MSESLPVTTPFPVLDVPDLFLVFATAESGSQLFAIVDCLTEFIWRLVCFSATLRFSFIR